MNSKELQKAGYHFFFSNNVKNDASLNSATKLNLRGIDTRKKKKKFSPLHPRKKVLLNVNMNFSVDFSKFFFRICQSHLLTPAGDLYLFFLLLVFHLSAFQFLFNLDSSLDDNSCRFFNRILSLLPSFALLACQG